MGDKELKDLITKLIDSNLGIICDSCRRQEKRNKLSYHKDFQLSIIPSKKSHSNFNFEFSESKQDENKENINCQDYFQYSKSPSFNKTKSSKSHALELDPMYFPTDLSAIKPVSQVQSPMQKKRKISHQYKSTIQLIRKEQQTTYEKILKAKK